jgi:diadenosine tetraphosphate (Ap4A) HIT family hydrolase
MGFTLHPQLAADTLAVGNLPLCRVLLMNNRHFPWLILVPAIPDLREIFDLAPQDYNDVMAEVRTVCEGFAAFTRADKMNVATLGNMVPQLHIHIIARHTQDAAWPQPVWNCGVKPEAYDATELNSLSGKLFLQFSPNITKM